MFFFISLVVGVFMLVVAIAWLRWWKRDPGQFKASWRNTPMPGSPMQRQR